MKIGDFSKKFGISIDTVRYYVENGLLLPEKVHNQRKFDERCISDMETILELKSMKFSISDIKKMFSLLRLTNLGEDHYKDYYLTLFRNKKKELDSEIEDLNNSVSLINEKIKEIKDINVKKTSKRNGVPLSFFAYLYCPECDKMLKLDNASVIENQVFNGNLNCDCGYSAYIKDGVIVTDSAIVEENKPLNVDAFFFQSIRKADPLYISHISRCLEWIYKRFAKSDLKGKKILEAGAGFGIFLKEFILRDSAFDGEFYIACDIYHDVLSHLKNSVEQSYQSSANVIYISSDFTKLPLKSESIDVVFDIFGTTTHKLYNSTTALSEIAKYLVTEGSWYGSYKYVLPGEAWFKEGFRKCENLFRLDCIRTELEEFKQLEIADIGNTQNIGEYAKVLKEGSTLNFWTFMGKKK